MAEPSADPERLKSCAAAIAARLSQAKSPAILVDPDVARYDAVVIHGRLETEIAGRSAAVAAEAVIIIPAGVPHLIRNSSADPVRYLDADLVAATGYAKLDPGGR
jgi:hypothetical protein